MMSMWKAYLTSLTLLLAPAVANATPMLTDLGADQYRVAFDPLTFEMTTSGEFSAIVFEDFYASSSTSCGFPVSGTVQTSVNGGAVEALTGNTCTGIYDSLNDVDGNDLLVTIHDDFLTTFGPVSVGDFVTVSTSDYVFDVAGLAPASSGKPFDAFVVNNVFERISEIVSTGDPRPVPEPGALYLLVLGLAFLGLSRRGQPAF